MTILDVMTIFRIVMTIWYLLCYILLMNMKNGPDYNYDERNMSPAHL